MEYRKLPHGEEQLSILGLGTSSIGMAGEKEIEATMELALGAGGQLLQTWPRRMRHPFPRPMGGL